jgi:hypothetical protein
LQIETLIVSIRTADTKPVKQEVNGTVIRPPLVFPDLTMLLNKGSFTLAKVSAASLLNKSLCLAAALGVTPSLTFAILKGTVHSLNSPLL